MELVRLLSVGDRFLDEWEIEGEVGKGGFSVVYRASHADGRVAAVKILTPEGEHTVSSPTYDAELADRFLREARLLDQLDSAYTIRLWDYGESPDGLLYMIFEFVDGRMLFDEIKDHGAMEEARVIHVLRQTLVALESAHELGILHRDIKPNNIMLYDRDGDPDRVKLVDFGIAKMFDEDKALPGNDLTAAGLLVGTPRYMAPEQLKGQDLTPAADLYSLGLCAIEMLTGKKCIPGKDRVKIVERQLNPIPITVPEDVVASRELVDIVHRLTQKRIESRYRDATDALRDLERLAGDPGTTGDTLYQSVDLSDILPKKAAAADDEDDATIFETINTAELQSIMDRQKAEAEARAASSGENVVVDPFGDTMAGRDLVPPELRAQFQQQREDATVEARPTARALAGLPDPVPRSSGFASSFDAAYGSGEFDSPVDRSYGSGPLDKPSSGALSPPSDASSSYGSGQFQQPPPPTAYGSGQFQQPPVDQSYGSGQFRQPPGGAYGSGQFQQPPAPHGAYGSGQFQQPPPAAYGSGQFQQPPGMHPMGSGQYPAPPYGSGQYPVPGPGQGPGYSGQYPVPPDPHGSGYYQPMPPHAPPGYPGGPPGPYGGGPPIGPAGGGLTGDDKLALAAGFVVPGVGQIIAGQIAKGGAIMLLLLVLLIFVSPLLWIVFAPLSLGDTFLLVRAQKRRPVAKFEFFADWQDFMR